MSKGKLIYKARVTKLWLRPKHRSNEITCVVEVVPNEYETADALTKFFMVYQDKHRNLTYKVVDHTNFASEFRNFFSPASYNRITLEKLPHHPLEIPNVYAAESPSEIKKFFDNFIMELNELNNLTYAEGKIEFQLGTSCVF